MLSKQSRSIAKRTTADRFLLLLARANTIATPRPGGEGEVHIPGERLAISPAEAADLVSRGLAAWRTPSEFVISDAGRSWARRQLAVETPYRAQHGELRAAEAGGTGTVIDLAESPLLWLHRRKDKSGEPLVGDAMFAAGERLRSDFTYGGMAPRMTVNWNAAGGGEGGFRAAEPTESALAARQRVRKAIEAVGPELSGVLLDVCCFLRRLEEVESDRRWPARSAKIILSLALTRLARHYGYSDFARGRGVRRESATPPQGHVQPPN